MRKKSVATDPAFHRVFSSAGGKYVDAEDLRDTFSGATRVLEKSEARAGAMVLAKTAPQTLGELEAKYGIRVPEAGAGRSPGAERPPGLLLAFPGGTFSEERNG